MKVRGLIQDVGRKTFTLDYLKQLAKVLSWYKLNDFQVHLNDNYIQLEQYKNVNGEDRRLIDPYSAFRLESDIKKGGNDGKNQADLTRKRRLLYERRIRGLHRRMQEDWVSPLFLNSTCRLTRWP